MFIGLIEFAKPFRALSKQQLVDLFVEGRKFNRVKRLPSAKKLQDSPIGLGLHDAHHAYVENLASSGQRIYNSYRFTPITPQLVKNTVRRDPSVLRELQDFSPTSDRVSAYINGELPKIYRKNNRTEDFVSGLEGFKPKDGYAYLSESKDYWKGRRARKKLPRTYKDAQYMEKGTQFVGQMKEAWEEASRVPISSPTSSRYYYRKRFGKVEKVRKGDS